MSDHARVAWSTLLGGIIGGVYGYLYLTEHGRTFRAQIDPRLDDFVDELRRLRGTVERAREAAREGRGSFAQIFGERSDPEAWESDGPRRASS